MKRYSTFDRTFWWSVIPFLFIVILILFIPYWIISGSWFGMDFSETGQIGDTIGGLIGPFIAIIAAFLTYMAFWVQFKANKQQWQSIQIDRLENRIYEMLNLHRQNVIELQVHHYREDRRATGRDIFPILFEELKLTYYCIEEFINEQLELKKTCDKNKITEAAQLIFFIGVRNTNNDLLESKLIKIFDKSTVDNLIPRMWSQSASAKNNITISNGKRYTREFRNFPFRGYVPTLGHYYRHLYQMVKYIVDYPENALSKDEKYKYTKTIRAQLSSHEQLLLYYNSLTEFGKAWREDKYLTDYNMIKNIPLLLADFGIKPEEKFAREIKELRAKGEELFEWSG